MSVTREELLRLRRQEPFQPFRIHTTGGEVFEIRDTINILVAEWVVVVPVRSNPDDLFGDYGASVPYEQIARVEMMGAASAAPNG
ncbi:MAG TPA: hypothetical protein VMS17_13295 [Gemmataceae bacterium]|nr:hypothetical protein [Gemmataceae bacterium]